MATNVSRRPAGSTASAVSLRERLRRAEAELASVRQRERERALEERTKAETAAKASVATRAFAAGAGKQTISPAGSSKRAPSKFARSSMTAYMRKPGPCVTIVGPTRMMSTTIVRHSRISNVDEE